MAAEFKLPDLGENVESADVVDVLISPGDTVEKDQSIIEAETEKAVMEIPSTVAGTVQEVKVSAGDTVKVGEVLFTYDESAGGGEQKTEAAESKQAEAAGEQTSEGDAAATAKESGTGTEQATPAPEAPSPGEKETFSGDRASDAAPKGGETPQPAETPSAEEDRAKPPIAAAPSVRHFARELGIDIHQVPGSGPGGRISIDDVKDYARQALGGDGQLAAAGGAAAGPRTQREPMSKVRKLTAQHMAKAWAEIPHVTVDDKADVTDLEAARQHYKKAAEAKGGKLTITAIFVRLCAEALKQHPTVNASIDTQAQQIEYHNYYNIGVAVDTPRGLVVPVIRDADQKSVTDLAVELTEISAKARDAKLTPDEMSGATFTITNLGSIGTGHFTPIVNPPEAAILGMGRAKHEPVWDEPHGAFLPRLMAPLSLSIDHRLVDGADGSRFLRWIVDAVERPISMLL